MNKLLHIDKVFYSCQYIEGGIDFYFGDQMRMCCLADRLLPNKNPDIGLGTYKGDGLPIDFILMQRNRIRLLNQTKDPRSCYGCANLIKKKWMKAKEPFSIITVNTSSLCNLACIYCSASGEKKFSTQPGYSIFVLFEELLGKGYLDKDATVIWGGGEPTLAKDFDISLMLLFEHRINQVVCTNSVLFSNAIKKGFVKKKPLSIIVSVDSGNQETYLKIKGLDKFYQVWENIGKYSTIGTVCAKYILYSLNNDKENILGFIERCKSNGVNKIMLSAENSELNKNKISEKTHQAAKFMIQEAEDMGLSVDTQFFPDSVSRETESVANIDE